MLFAKLSYIGVRSLDIYSADGLADLLGVVIHYHYRKHSAIRVHCNFIKQKLAGVPAADNKHALCVFRFFIL